MRSSIARSSCGGRAWGNRRQANQKDSERAQTTLIAMRRFAHINETVKAAIKAREPAISIDTKKKELIGDYKAVGRELQPTGVPVQVQGHDFPDPQVPRAFPYGIYDITNDEGWVNVGNRLTPRSSRSPRSAPGGSTSDASASPMRKP